MRVLHVALAITFATVAACAGSGSRGSPTEPVDTSFRDQQRVTIRGYTGVAMEPFITRDGAYLLFNSSNAPGVNTDIQVARIVDGLTFDYVGPLTGANSTVLDGVPTVDASGTMYFVSIRSYETTAQTIYRADFANGAASNVALVPGLPTGAGVVVFDVEVTPDGNSIWFADGRFSGAPVPDAADLVLATRTATGFQPAANGATILARVNTDALEYAAGVGGDDRELFFTRLRGTTSAIYRATRSSSTAAFGTPARIAAIDGFVEGPTVSADGRALYYHRREGDSYAIYRVTR